jgi:hypothetical protein
MPTRNAHIPYHNKASEAMEDFLEDTMASASGMIPQPILDKIEELSKQWYGHLNTILKLHNRLLFASHWLFC